MNTRLKIICILFGVSYLFLIGQVIYNEVIPEFVAGFKEGVKSVAKQHTGDETKESLPELYSFYVKPLSGSFTFPTPLKNLKTGKLVNAETNTFKIVLNTPVKLPGWIAIAKIIYKLSAFLILFFLIYIPILVYKLTRSIIQNVLFDEINVKRIRRIGYSILVLFGLLVFSSLVCTAEAKNVFSFEDYKIVHSLGVDYYLLLIGLITLLFAEILKISHKMKEEQDLTI
ncbi:MAG: DUF2975 domain-containing protein [Dysgonamonadaceae bacterium]|jgi:hypothetical protein|nr:DUF2975 domain-containing protein [Dysgonamonadaceae bacterium]